MIVAALAAQEKLNASPILLLCLYCDGLLVADTFVSARLGSTR